MEQHIMKYQIRGMHCASCASTIKRRLANVPGVTDVKVNLATETAEIAMASHVDNASLNAPLSPLGYQLISKDSNMSHSGHSMSTVGGVHADHDMGPVTIDTKATKLAELNLLKRKVL